MKYLRRVRVALILFALAIVATAPSIVGGLLSERAGIKALEGGESADAAAAFASAAAKLAWKPQLWEAAGLAAYQAGDYVAATQMLQAARDRDALSATGWEALGTSLWAAGEPGIAMNIWLLGTQRHPGAAELWDRLAGAFHALNQYDQEESALRQRLAVKNDAAAQYRLALLLIGWDNAGAIKALEAASSLDSQVAPAKSTLTAAIRAAGAENEAAAKLVIIGRGLGLVEEWALAVRAFSAAVQADARHAEARAWLGEARQHIDQNGRLDLDKAASLDPSSSVVHTLRGLYWRRNGNLGLSLAEYSRAAQLEPGNAGLQSLLGEAYAASGDLVAALEAYEAAVELAPEESSHWRLLALFSAENEVQTLDLGVAAGLRAVELSPHDPQALDALGWAYAQAGYLTKAEATLLRAVQEAPQYAAAHLHLGITYLRWGQNDLAREHLMMATRMDPGGPAGESALSLLQQYFPN